MEARAAAKAEKAEKAAKEARAAESINLLPNALVDRVGVDSLAVKILWTKLGLPTRCCDTLLMKVHWR